MSRCIGIRHRVKKTVEGEARPTEVCIVENGSSRVIIFETETDELDFIKGNYPISWRLLGENEDETNFPAHHVKTVRENKKVPSRYEGLEKGDKVGMIFGGSGDRLAFAISRRGEEIGAKLFRISAFNFKAIREQNGLGKESDSELLAACVLERLKDFNAVTARDRKLIILRGTFYRWKDAMNARLACEQRLRQRIIGEIFCNENGLFPEGEIEDIFNRKKANDAILQSLEAEEKDRLKEMKKVLEATEVYEKIFKPIVGVGPSIAARLIVAIGDIRRFPASAKLKKFCGVHVNHAASPDRQFPRKRRGETANWSPEARQALFLLGDQFNRNPESEWGEKLRQCKRKLREAHPNPILGDNGKKRYTDAHIHRMGTWRVLTKFTERLWKEWHNLAANDIMIV